MAVANRTLNASFSGTLSVQYRNTDTAEAGSNNTRDDVRYTDMNQALAFGTGLKQSDLSFHERVTLVGPVVNSRDYDDGFDDVWGVLLDFNAIKLLVIHNREATNLRPMRFLKVTTKTESFWIGPGGSRVISEVDGTGLRGEDESSSSVDEGDLILEVTGSYDVTYDLFIVGASAETSSSGV